MKDRGKAREEARRLHSSRVDGDGHTMQEKNIYIREIDQETTFCTCSIAEEENRLYCSGDKLMSYFWKLNTIYNPQVDIA